MGNLSHVEAGSAATLPGFGCATLERAAISPYQPTAAPAIEMATRSISVRFGLPARRARTIAELAGLGGRA